MEVFSNDKEKVLWEVQDDNKAGEATDYDEI